MNKLPLLLVVASSVVAGCSKSSSNQPAPAASESRVVDASASASPAASATPQRGDLTLTSAGLNGIDRRTPATRAGIVAGLGAGYVVRPKSISFGEGEEIPGLAIVRDGEELAVIYPDNGLVGAIELTSASIKTEDGLHLGSSFADLSAAKGSRKCQSVIAEGSAGRTGGRGRRLTCRPKW